jgi:ABC-type spermidine/putrescine transport system permease subunit I|tara:strand:+ start:4841 stop:5062 length:222 start_codon:yes stop_codon:yes gene_type:complete
MFRSFIKHWAKSLLFVASMMMIAWGSIQLGEYIAVVSDSENADKVTLAVSMAVVVLLGTMGWAYSTAKYDSRK